MPAVIVDARRAKAALLCRMNKTDPNDAEGRCRGTMPRDDAEGLAQLARTGRYREVLAKRRETRLLRALLLARQQLAGQRRSLESQIRALLCGFGLLVGTVSKARFEARVWELVAREPLLGGIWGRNLGTGTELTSSPWKSKHRRRSITTSRCAQAPIIPHPTSPAFLHCANPRRALCSGKIR